MEGRERKRIVVIYTDIKIKRRLKGNAILKNQLRKITQNNNWNIYERPFLN